MPVYVVGRIEIADRERYAGYEAGFLEIFARHGGELLAVDDAPRLLEGEQRPHRCVIARFPDEAAAMAWYRSDDYQRLAEIRWASSTGSVALATGFA